MNAFAGFALIVAILTYALMPEPSSVRVRIRHPVRR